MKLLFEFLTVFRQKIGRESLMVRLDDRPGQLPTVRDALEALERTVGGGFMLLEGGRVAGGILIFRKTPTGALERVRNPEDQSIVDGENLVLSIAMEGG